MMTETLTKPNKKVVALSTDKTLLKGRDILCFSNDWSGDPLSKTHLMRLLARDNRVLWINSIGYRAPTVSKADVSRAFNKLAAAASPMSEPEKNIFVLNPLAIPAYGKPSVRALNRHLLRLQVKRAMRRLEFKRPINWVFLPSAAVVAGALDEELLIYHCVDEYTAFSGVSSKFQGELEEQLLRKSDLVIVSSDLLYESKAKVNPHTVLVRHGVDHAHFRRALAPETAVPEEIAKLPKPVIGFFGLIADWVDLELIAEVAKRFQHGSVVMLGKVTTDTTVLENLPNVHLLGRKRYEDLPAYSKGFDVALMPFRINELTLNSNPLKVREYLAAGLQVVSTAIPEVEVLNLCRIGADAESFVREVEEALKTPGPHVEQSEAVRGESWEARIDEIQNHLAALDAPARR
ncbi:MAG TPA: glycosyltransferase [Pyrinomonadaceae bacterium]|jgi:glycosyltransferase involved in cell wall biosynthesis|nr:glycosyltransferase [Pyrinomonadaceae bacterium]